MAVLLTGYVDPAKMTLAIMAVNAVSGSKKKTLSFPDGTVASLQDNSTVQNPIMQDRPLGTNGRFETCDVVETGPATGVATWYYDWNGQAVGPIAIAFTLVTGK